MKHVLARLRNVATVLAVAMLGMVFLAGPGAAEGNTDQVCEGLDSGKIDVAENTETVTITAPEGSLITGYCVKAGSTQQGNGPLYVVVDPPQESVTISYTDKDISHYSYSYEAETPPEECVPEDYNGEEPGCGEPPEEGEELAVPAAPEMLDPCDAGNASWVEPADTEVLDWTLDDEGNLSVTILTPDTVFTGTDSNTHSFGPAVETNTDPCVKGEEGEKDPPKNPDSPDNPDNPETPETPETPEVKGAEATVVPTTAVPTTVDAGLGTVQAPQGDTRNPLWLLVVGGGLGLMGLAGLRRRAVGSR